MSQNFLSRTVKQNANHTDSRPFKTLSVVTVIPTCAQVWNAFPECGLNCPIVCGQAKVTKVFKSKDMKYTTTHRHKHQKFF